MTLALAVVAGALIGLSLGALGGGRAAWWSPRWLTRVLPKITFSHG